MRHKKYKLKLESVKKVSKNETEFGIFTGLASTFQVDSENEQMMPGTFNKAIGRLKEDGKTHIQMKFMHQRSEIIGGFPLSKASETEKGFFVEGEVNLNVQKGNESFSLLKQGVITDMSIGFFLNSFDMNENITEITDIDLTEISLVDRPANRGAVISDVKFDLSTLKSLRDVDDLFKQFGLSNKESNKLISIIKSKEDRDDSDLGIVEFSSKIDEILLGIKIYNMSKTMRSRNESTNFNKTRRVWISDKVGTRSD